MSNRDFLLSQIFFGNLGFVRSPDQRPTVVSSFEWMDRLCPFSRQVNLDPSVSDPKPGLYSTVNEFRQAWTEVSPV